MQFLQKKGKSGASHLVAAILLVSFAIGSAIPTGLSASQEKSTKDFCGSVLTETKSEQNQCPSCPLPALNINGKNNQIAELIYNNSHNRGMGVAEGGEKHKTNELFSPPYRYKPNLSFLITSNNQILAPAEILSQRPDRPS